jgi:hypothetical protein
VNNQGRPLQVHRQNFEQQMRIGRARLVVDTVADIAGLEKEIARAVDRGLGGKMYSISPAFIWRMPGPR